MGEGENVDKLKKTINDIEYGKDLLQNRPEQDTVDYKLYDILNNALELLKEQQREISTLHRLLEKQRQQIEVLDRKTGVS